MVYRLKVDHSEGVAVGFQPRVEKAVGCQPKGRAGMCQVGGNSVAVTE